MTPRPGRRRARDHGADGSFAFDSPPVTPGTVGRRRCHGSAREHLRVRAERTCWVGAVQCGNVGLQMGWNHVGYFGAGPLTLGATSSRRAGPGACAPSTISRTAARRTPTGSRDTPIGRTPDDAGAGRGLLVPRGRVVRAPVRVLALGPPAGAAEGGLERLRLHRRGGGRAGRAFEHRGSYAEVYRYANDGAGERWLSFGATGDAGLGAGFDYGELRVVHHPHDADATLQPLQP